MLVQPDEVATRLASWVQPRIEPEITFITPREIDSPLTREDAAAYVDSVLLVAEILDSRFHGYRFRLPDVVADNTSAAGVSLPNGARHQQLVPAGSLVLAGALTDASPLHIGHRYDLAIDSLGHMTILA